MARHQTEGVCVTVPQSAQAGEVNPSTGLFSFGAQKRGAQAYIARHYSKIKKSHYYECNFYKFYIFSLMVLFYLF
jgi:hypothetical protein